MVPKQQARTAIIQASMPSQTPLYDAETNSTPATWIRYLVDVDKFVTSSNKYAYDSNRDLSALYCIIGNAVHVAFTNTGESPVTLTLPEYPAQVCFLPLAQGSTVSPLWLSTSVPKITVPAGASVNGSYLKRQTNIVNRSE